MSANVRKLIFSLHIVFALGWFGSVASFLVLAICGLKTHDVQLMRACYLAMDLVSIWIILPFGFATFLTGLIQSLGTSWGLFRHYWILIKFLLTIGALVILVIHMKPIKQLAGSAAAQTLMIGDLGGLKLQLVVDAVAALIVLSIATVLSVYKPAGLTPYGHQKLQGKEAIDWTGIPGWVKGFATVTGILLGIFILKHLFFGGFKDH